MKKLNNKGFTLVELLAVVVILAVVMGIATTSVITAMNNSRKGSLEDSAKSVSRAFTTKYSEAMVLGGASDVYGKDDVLGTRSGYNFTIGSTSNPVFYYLDENLKDDLNISPDTYVLHSNNDKMTNTSSISESFVAFNGEKVVVCLVANKKGNYYVANAVGTSTDVMILGNSVTFANNVMWACSNELKSWEVVETSEPEVTEPVYEVSLGGTVEPINISIGESYEDPGVFVIKDGDDYESFTVKYQVDINGSNVEFNDESVLEDYIKDYRSSAEIYITYNVYDGDKLIATKKRKVVIS